MTTQTNHQLLKDSRTPSFNKIELIKRYSARYDRDMPIELGINAEFATNCYFRGDHSRQHAGGGYEPVGYSQGGIPSGMRRLQHGLDRNTRSVSFGALVVPDNFWSLLKFTKEKTIMIALSTGINTPTHTAQLSYTDTPTGIIAYQNALPVAWIGEGYHTGGLNNQPHTCTFVDVAYTRKTFQCSKCSNSNSLYVTSSHEYDSLNKSMAYRIWVSKCSNSNSP